MRRTGSSREAAASHSSILSPPGVGKTAIAEGLAQRIVAGDVPPGLMGFSVLELDLPSLVRRLWGFAVWGW